MNKPLDIPPPPTHLAIDTPNPFEGEMAAEDALLLLNALRWAKEAAQDPEDFEPLQTLLDNLLPVLRDQVETARAALSACRSMLEASHE